jgi:hypothetical protein
VSFVVDEVAMEFILLSLDNQHSTIAPYLSITQHIITYLTRHFAGCRVREICLRMKVRITVLSGRWYL